MKPTRVSRQKRVVRGSLVGLTCDQYYRTQKFTNTNFVKLAGKYLPANILKKFDRGRPLTQKQGTLVVDALNKVLYDLADHFPFETPCVKLRRKIPRGQLKGHVYQISSYVLIRMPKVGTDNGTVYKSSPQKLSYGGHTGEIGFSSHAINRMMERTLLSQLCKTDILLPLDVMKLATTELKVSQGTHGLQLHIGPLGFMPLIWDKQASMWVCKTFLERTMRGTPIEEEKKMARELDKLFEKYPNTP